MTFMESVYRYVRDRRRERRRAYRMALKAEEGKIYFIWKQSNGGVRIGRNVGLERVIGAL